MSKFSDEYMQEVRVPSFKNGEYQVNKMTMREYELEVALKKAIDYIKDLSTYLEGRPRPATISRIECDGIVQHLSEFVYKRESDISFRNYLLRP